MDREDNFTGAVSAVSPLAAATISCSLGDRRSMQIAINISCSDPAEVQDAMLDNAMRRMDRQQARYDLEGLEDKFNVVGMNTRQLIASLTGADVELNTRLARMKAELAGKEEGRKEIHDEAYNEHVASQRRGEFKPKGSVLQRLNVADRIHFGVCQQGTKIVRTLLDGWKIVTVPTVQRRRLVANRNDFRSHFRIRQMTPARRRTGKLPAHQSQSDNSKAHFLHAVECDNNPAKIKSPFAGQLY